MSKNVAVFVDVANIFYAAKAAGVDIDYVTLLRAAVSGRDFVRAYAYTGLDPENENQRQFHSFLARNGYKVVSKDIRKYGDGKVKANLDIELVVDMMKTARNLDVAVVVSGDGDFAPAIRAVQEMGVRVEVISFRGNTSSDLIEVADVFTDITQIARVERGSSRSGRRVAAGDEDLSMTEVPDKETEGAPRRRRGRTRPEVVAERPVERAPARRAVADAPVAHGPLVVLPGEKLKRAVPAVASDEQASEETGSVVRLEDEEEAGPESTADQAAGDQAAGEAGHRRRRRRGGRGRGRGRGVEGVTEGVTEAGVEAAVEEGAEEDEEEIRPAPRIPAHSTFGSVWDSQLGMPSAPVATGGDLEVGEEEEPEIPEYLLAERRQHARGGRGHGRGGGGARSAYQQAMDRERYGRGGGPAGPVTGPRRDQRDRGGRPGGPGRPDRNRQPRPASFEARPAPGGDPWTEVPPELEEMLRAELARKGGPGPRPEARPASGATGRGRGGPRGERPAASPVGTQPADVPALAAGAAADVSTPSASEGGAPPRRRGRPPAVAAAPKGSSGEAAPSGDSPASPLSPVPAPGRRATGGPAAPGRQRRTVTAPATGAAEPAPEPPAPRQRGRAASGGRSDSVRGTGTEAAAESPAAAPRRGRAAPRAVAQPPAASDAPDAPAPRKQVTRRAPSAPAE